MRWLTRRLPPALKRIAPIVRERDELLVEVEELRARLESEAPAAPPPATGLHGTYVGDRRMLVSTVWGGRLLVPSDDLSLMPELVAHGTYDAPFTAFVQRHVKRGDTVIDVGANVGLFTLLSAYQVWEDGCVIAYEASPPMLELLRDNVAMSWLDDRVEIVPRAAAAEHGTLPFLVPRRYAMTGSLRPIESVLSTATRVDEVDRIEVETEPLDVHIGRFERIALVKIDVEGAEDQVLAGMEGLLASGVVDCVSFEVARVVVGDEWDAFSGRLRRLAGEGWTFATISDTGIPEPIALDTVLERARFSQILMRRGA